MSDIPNLARQLNAAQQQQSQIIGMRVMVAKDILQELIRQKCMEETRINTNDLEHLAGMAVRGADALLVKMGLLRKSNQEEERYEQ